MNLLIVAGHIDVKDAFKPKNEKITKISRQI